MTGLQLVQEPAFLGIQQHAELLALNNYFLKGFAFLTAACRVLTSFIQFLHRSVNLSY